ncbi:hypothetical protein LCGC14_0948880 [marine sediment metagenome]|uniref:Uncharacterized protein n=1 Tax=marine sediment metagenome TaxID=412755 RepID=A0A0F9P3Z8_9ZZZZ
MIEYGDCKECKHNVDCPHKPKPLAQYLDEYIEHEVKLDNIESADMYAYNSWRELLEQALGAYELTENVTIKIERK